MKLTHIKVTTKSDPETALILNGHTIIKTTRSRGEDIAIPSITGHRIAKALNLKLEHLNVDKKDDDWDWNQLLTDHALAPCNACNRELRLDGYCSNDECQYHDWPQTVDIGNLKDIDSGTLKRIPVDGIAFADDDTMTIHFDASEYLCNAKKSGALLKAITELNDCECRDFYPDNSISSTLQGHAKTVYEYQTLLGGFRCHIDSNTLTNWLKSHQPELINALTHIVNEHDSDQLGDSYKGDKSLAGIHGDKIEGVLVEFTRDGTVCWDIDNESNEPIHIVRQGDRICLVDFKQLDDDTYTHSICGHEATIFTNSKMKIIYKSWDVSYDPAMNNTRLDISPKYT
ncbi:hypothetical protein AB4571_01790 [Vibrio breoganii]